MILLYFVFQLITCADAKELIESVRNYEDLEEGVAEEVIQVIKDFSETSCNLDENVN